MQKTIILASQSPRRQELLKAIGLKFEILNPNISEITSLKKPSFIVKDIAYQKALKIKNNLSHKAIIISADTIVFCNKEIIGKPKSYEDAKRILKKLTRYPQFVYTGFVIMNLYTGETYTGYEKTKVIMNPIPSNLLDKIISENMDKAGCYAIQSKDKLVKSITGDYYNVVGLPLKKVVEILKKCDIEIDDKKYSKLLTNPTL
jgi:septum formation protein